MIAKISVLVTGLLLASGASAANVDSFFRCVGNKGTVVDYRIAFNVDSALRVSSVKVLTVNEIGESNYDYNDVSARYDVVVVTSNVWQLIDRATGEVSVCR